MKILYEIKLLELYVHFNPNQFGDSFNLKKKIKFQHIIYLYIYRNIYSHTIHIYIGSIWGMAFSPDGRFLATGSVDKTVNLIKLEYIL